MASSGNYKIVLDFTPFVEAMQKISKTFGKFRRAMYVSEGWAPGPFKGSVDV